MLNPVAPGCKRLIVDPGYLKSLHRPNVTLTFDAIERVVPRGVQLKTGEIVPLDVLIFGTGFSLVCLPPLDLRTPNFAPTVPPTSGDNRCRRPPTCRLLGD